MKRRKDYRKKNGHRAQFTDSAPALGAGGRGFESRYPDKKKGNLSSTMSCLSFYIHFSSKRVLSSDLQKRLSVCFQTQVHLK